MIKALTFDYLLQKGKTAQGNAVKILRVYGYPEEVVRRAKAILENGQESSFTKKCLPLRP